MRKIVTHRSKLLLLQFPSKLQRVIMQSSEDLPGVISETVIVHFAISTLPIRRLDGFHPQVRHTVLGCVVAILGPIGDVGCRPSVEFRLELVPSLVLVMVHNGYGGADHVGPKLGPQSEMVDNVLH